MKNLWEIQWSSKSKQQTGVIWRNKNQRFAELRVESSISSLQTKFFFSIPKIEPFNEITKKMVKDSKAFFRSSDAFWLKIIVRLELRFPPWRDTFGIQRSFEAWKDQMYHIQHLKCIFFSPSDYHLSDSFKPLLRSSHPLSYTFYQPRCHMFTKKSGKKWVNSTFGQKWPQENT